MLFVMCVTVYPRIQLRCLFSAYWPSNNYTFNFFFINLLLTLCLVFIHFSFTVSPLRLCIRTIFSFGHSFVFLTSIMPSFVRCFIYSIHSFIHWFIHSLVTFHSLVHSILFSCSFIPTLLAERALHHLELIVNSCAVIVQSRTDMLATNQSQYCTQSRPITVRHSHRTCRWFATARLVNNFFTHRPIVCRN